VHEIRCNTVIVGGGSTGSVLASRLSEDRDHSVVLVEAGSDYGPASEDRWPPELLALDAKAGFVVSNEWGFWNEHRPGGGAYHIACGKVLGGSSSINAAGWMWPKRVDFEAWAAAGGSAWSYDEMLPRLQGIESDPVATGSWHGRNGPVPVARNLHRPLMPFHQAFGDAAAALGFPWLEDGNDPNGSIGFSRKALNTREGKRWNAAFAFLDPARGRPNLRIMDDTLATRILFEERTAIGVDVTARAGPMRILSDRVVVSAGAYNSPAVLMRSGIGPAEELRRHGIAVVWDLPGVGQNLSDHPVIPMSLCATEAGAAIAAKLTAEGRLYLFQTCLRFRSSRSQDRGHDIQISLMGERAAQDGWDYLLRIEIVKPHSRGFVRLRSASPREAPIIDGRFVSDDNDAQAVVEAIHLVRKLSRTPPLDRLVAAERWPSETTPDTALPAFARANAYSYHHPNGTCKMGPDSDPMAVVDGRCQVRGVERLFVADASIMPSVPRAAINISCLALGERAADLLRKVWGAGSAIS